MNQLEYWQECIEEAANECALSLTPEQAKYMAEAVSSYHENYGMAFYSPPPSERLNAIEQEWKDKLMKLQKEYDSYIKRAESAVKQALGQSADTAISIGEYGEVTRFGGRTQRIQ